MRVPNLQDTHVQLFPPHSIYTVLTTSSTTTYTYITYIHLSLSLVETLFPVFVKSHRSWEFSLLFSSLFLVQDRVTLQACFSVSTSLPGRSSSSLKRFWRRQVTRTYTVLYRIFLFSECAQTNDDRDRDRDSGGAARNESFSHLFLLLSLLFSSLLFSSLLPLFYWKPERERERKRVRTGI